MTTKLTATMFLSVDGVYQGTGAPDEDRRGRFVTSVWRLFAEHGQTHRLTLRDSKATPSGVLVQTHRPDGRAIFRNAGE